MKPLCRCGRKAPPALAVLGTLALAPWGIAAALRAAGE